MVFRPVDLVGFLKNDLWRLHARELPFLKAVMVRAIRVVLLSFRGISENKIYLRASALTFYSMLSIVPVLAMAFGIAKGFGFEKMLERQLLQELPGQEKVLIRVIEFANSMLATAKGGLVAGVGLVVLFWTVISVIGNIEEAFNEIWHISRHRSLARKFSDYLSIMLICPLLMIMAGSATVFITTQVTLITERIYILGYFSPLIFLGLKILPWFMVGGMFTFIYILMPNTRVKFLPGLIGGMVAGAVYQIAQWAYISFQIGVARINAIYGSFAALPLFLIWLQLSWMITLFGAGISFSCQNVDLFEFEPDTRKASPYLKAFLSLGIVRFIVKSFAHGDPPPTFEKISRVLGIPLILVRELLSYIIRSGLIVPVETGQEEDGAYVPRRDINAVTVYTVIRALVHNEHEDLLINRSEDMQEIKEILEGWEDLVESSSSNRLLKEI